MFSLSYFCVWFFLVLWHWPLGDVVLDHVLFPYLRCSWELWLVFFQLLQDFLVLESYLLYVGVEFYFFIFFFSTTNPPASAISLKLHLFLLYIVGRCFGAAHLFHWFTCLQQTPTSAAGVPSPWPLKWGGLCCRWLGFLGGGSAEGSRLCVG